MTVSAQDLRSTRLDPARLWAMARKETIQLRRDRRSLLLAFALPLLLLVLFGYAIVWDVRDIALAVVDQDRSAESRELVDGFLASGYFQLVGAARAPGRRRRALRPRHAAPGARRAARLRRRPRRRPHRDRPGPARRLGRQHRHHRARLRRGGGRASSASASSCTASACGCRSSPSPGSGTTRRSRAAT